MARAVSNVVISAFLAACGFLPLSGAVFPAGCLVFFFPVSLTVAVPSGTSPEPPTSGPSIWLSPSSSLCAPPLRTSHSRHDHRYGSLLLNNSTWSIGDWVHQDWPGGPAPLA